MVSNVNLHHYNEGSTTACITVLDPVYGVLRGANVGDSGFMVVRGVPSQREAGLATGSCDWPRINH